jgi:hypothetical protein
MGDDCPRNAVALVHLGDPARLAELVVALPFGFAMHRRQHVVPGGVAPVVVRQIVAADRAVVAHEEIVPVTAQTRVHVPADLPQVMMRVDQGHRVG